jgi:ribosome biogenesis GTPase A
MAKSIRLIKESLALVDVVIELLDARIPGSSRNPEIGVLANGKKLLVALSKADLADPGASEQWKRHYESQGIKVALLDSLTGKGVDKMAEACRELCKDKIERQKARGRLFVPVRAMIAGVPNAGKSTLINRYAGKAITKTEDRPGVTRAKQWIRIKKDLDLLDTPGLLWPKIEDPAAGVKLAITGAIRDETLDLPELSRKLIEMLQAMYPGALKGRYQIEGTGKSAQVVEDIARARGFLLKGGECDTDRASIVLLDEFRAGKLGRITLERP